MRKISASILYSLLKVTIAAGLIFFLIQQGKFNLQSFDFFKNYQVVLLGMILVTVILWAASERWRLFLKAQRFQVSWLQALKFSLIGTFFNFLPGSIGGDVLRAVYIAKQNSEQQPRAVSTVVVDRIFGVFAMSFLAVISFFFAPDRWMENHFFKTIFFISISIFMGLIVFAYLVLTQKLKIYSQIVSQYRLGLKSFAQILGMSLISQFGQILLFAVIAFYQFPSEIKFSSFMFAVPLGFMVTLLPIVPMGVGMGQAAFLILFSQYYGYETYVGVVGITAYQSFVAIFGLVGALLFIFSKHGIAKRV